MFENRIGNEVAELFGYKKPFLGVAILFSINTVKAVVDVVMLLLSINSSRI